MSEQKSGFSKSCTIFILILILLCCFCGSLCLGTSLLFSSMDTSLSSTAAKATDETVLSGKEESANKILSIPIHGAIYTERGNGGGFNLLGGESVVYGYDIKDELVAAAKRDDIKGVLLEIDSPGGTITGAKAISDGIEYYRKQTNKPVIAYISGMAASGSYWAAIAADEVIADYGSMAGSIGVIFGPFKYYNGVIEEGSDLTGKVVTQSGIETSYITAGGSKDLGSPYRRVTPEELQVIQEGVNQEYDLFVDYVAARRKISATKIKTEIKALIYSTKQALALKLVDKIANRDDAYARIVELTKLGEDYKIVREQKVIGFFESLLGVAYLNTAEGSAKAKKSENCRICDQALFFHGNPLESNLW